MIFEIRTLMRFEAVATVFQRLTVENGVMAYS